MKKSKSSLTIQLPKNASESILAALTGEEVLVDGNSVIINSSSLKDLRSRWNTVMRSIEVSSSILKKMEF
tara:strand:+ start:175 stop:384 length:210 start_codon:yes stop_codon:yes gene_type:complete